MGLYGVQRTVHLEMLSLLGLAFICLNSADTSAKQNFFQCLQNPARSLGKSYQSGTNLKPPFLKIRSRRKHHKAVQQYQLLLPDTLGYRIAKPLSLRTRDQSLASRVEGKMEESPTAVFVSLCVQTPSIIVYFRGLFL